MLPLKINFVCFFLYFVANNGEYLVLYESNILYYGRIGMEYMVQVYK